MMRSLKYLVLTTTAVSILAISAVWILAGQLSQPTRKSIHDYQLDWFENPKKHGILLVAKYCDHGRVPCLLVAPDRNASPSKRGTILREQLAGMGGKLLPFGQTRGILVLLHGRNGRKEDLLPVAERFASVGFNCVIPDLPAHGESPIKNVRFAFDQFERNIASNVLEDSRRFFHDLDAPAGIWGLSMGGAFAIRAVSDSPQQWRAIAVVSSFDTLKGVIEDKLSAFPMAFSRIFVNLLTFLTQYREGPDLETVKPVSWASSVNRPVFVAHGDSDSLISLDRGYRLFEAFSSKDKTWLVVPGGDHNNILVTDMPLYAEMAAWFAVRFDCNQDAII